MLLSLNKKAKLSLIAVIMAVTSFFASFGASYAGDCKKTGSVCVDSTPCKTVSGEQVCLSQFGLTCWEYKDTYTCIKPNAVNYCQPFVNLQPTCWQTSSQCVQMDTILNTGCMTYQYTWRCSDPVNPTPSNTIKLDDTYTLVSSSYDKTPCDPQESATCDLAESKCIDSSPPPLPPGISPSQVAPDGCYERQDTYACISGDFSSDCSAYANDPNCRLVETKVADGAGVIEGHTTAISKRYECISVPSRTRTIEDCSNSMFCIDGNCFDSGFSPDQDVLRVAASMEAAREAGNYFDPNSFTLFRGEEQKCKRKLLKNCCDEGGDFMETNRGILMELGLQGAKWLGKEAFDMASKYVYDFMWDHGIFKDFAFDALADAAMASNFSTIGSLYGITVWTGTATTIPGAMGLGSVSSLFSVGGFQVGFDPYSLAISLGIKAVMSMLSCDEESIYTATYKETGLCHYIGEYCSKKIPVINVCYEWENGYCCYNSKMARIVNEEGRPQIGKGWGSAKRPDCSGFTPQQFERLNFEQMDLSEFYADIIPRDIQSMSTDVTNYMGGRIGELINAQ